MKTKQTIKKTLKIILLIITLPITLALFTIGWLLYNTPKKSENI